MSYVEICDFGSDNDLATCDWANRNGSQLRWTTGAGTLSNWLGGPARDASSSSDDAQRGDDSKNSKISSIVIKNILYQVGTSTLRRRTCRCLWSPRRRITPTWRAQRWAARALRESALASGNITHALAEISVCE